MVQDLAADVSAAHLDGPELSAAYHAMMACVRAQLDEEIHAVHTANFPSVQRVEVLCRLYFGHFHVLFPFVRRADVLGDWLLLLAVAAVGAQYAPDSVDAASDGALATVLDMVVTGLVDVGSSDDCCLGDPEADGLSLGTLQAMILNVVCKLHGGVRREVQSALAERYNLVAACGLMGLLSPAANQAQEAQTVSAWLAQESRLRTGMMVWLLDSMAAYEFDAPLLMQFADAKGALPCPDALWEAPSVHQVAAATQSSVPFLDAVEMLFMEKRLPEHLGEFGSLLLLHAVLRRNREVATGVPTMLSSWAPTTSSPTPSAPPRVFGPRVFRAATLGTWLPASPTLLEWRDIACGCMDLLHARASANAADFAGWEHPTTLFLHLCRLILLAPTAHLHTLADSAKDPARGLVLRWATRASLKARLAVIHAAAIFRHVRRCPTGSFMEPFAIYISTLVLWGYSISNARAAADQSTEVSLSDALEWMHGADGPEAPQPAFIHLDRPCDEETVQTYVQRGAHIPAFMAHIGDVMDEAAPASILREGIRLLRRISTTSPGTWGIEATYVKTLKSMLRVTGTHGME